jgi:isopentenyl-diphosphate delta-isomerase
VYRHAADELGMTLTDLELALPRFRYRATDASGVVENEVCPVYTARTADEPIINPREVAEAQWVDPADLATAVTAAPWAFSPWLVLQAAQLPLFTSNQGQLRRPIG